MALIFSRRAYDNRTQKFTNNLSTRTRYVKLTKTGAGSNSWIGGVISQQDWLTQVKSAGSTNEVLIYVHGFNTKQTDMLDRMGKIETQLKGQGFGGTVVAFDWPSDGFVLNYNSDRRDAKAAAPSLVADGVLPLLGMSPKPRVSLLAHSMGALVVLRGFSDFGDGAGSGSSNWKVDEACFVSADVDSAWFEKGAWASLVLDKRAGRFTNYWSGRDGVLQLAGGFISGGRVRVGQVGMPQLTSARHHDVYSNEQYLRDVPPSQQKKRYSHTWWFDNVGFFKDVRATIRGDAASGMATRKPTNTPPDQALLT